MLAALVGTQNPTLPRQKLASRDLRAWQALPSYIAAPAVNNLTCMALADFGKSERYTKWKTDRYTQPSIDTACVNAFFLNNGTACITTGASHSV